MTCNFSGFPKISQNFRRRNRENQHSPKHSLSVQLTHLLSFPIAPKLRGYPIRAFKLRTGFISQQRQFFQMRGGEAAYHNVHFKHFFHKRHFNFLWEKGLSSISVLLVWIKKKNPTVFCSSANINFLKHCKKKQQWKQKNIHSITRGHRHGGPYHTAVWHSRTRQGHQGIQALYWKRIWETISAAPSGSCLKNALENKSHSC